MRRHRFDPLSFVLGLLFAGAGAAYIARFLDPSLVQVRWIGALLLVGIGLTFLASALGSRSDHEDDAKP